MKKLLTSIFIFGCMLMASAQDINNYKYVIIPETYEFTGDVDEYRLNSLTKYLFEQNGFNTLMKTEEKPLDLKKDNCLGLQAKVEDESGLFVTKLVLKLLDCNDQVIFESPEGRSREKDFQVAYHEALRDAFKSIERIDYNYIENDKSENIPVVEVTGIPVAANKEVAENNNTDITEAEEIDEVIEEEPQEVTGNGLTQKQFQLSGKSYDLKKTEQGIGLYQENSLDPIAILVETNGGRSYIYTSLTNRGVAYFNTNGDLVVEYLDRQNNKESVIYKLKN